MLRIVCFAEEKIPKPELARFHLQFLDNRHNSVPPLCRIFGYLCMVKFGGRVNLVLFGKLKPLILKVSNIYKYLQKHHEFS